MKLTKIKNKSNIINASEITSKNYFEYEKLVSLLPEKYKFISEIYKHQLVAELSFIDSIDSLKKKTNELILNFENDARTNVWSTIRRFISIRKHRIFSAIKHLLSAIKYLLAERKSERVKSKGGVTFIIISNIFLTLISLTSLPKHYFLNFLNNKNKGKKSPNYFPVGKQFSQFDVCVFLEDSGSKINQLTAEEIFHYSTNNSIKVCIFVNNFRLFTELSRQKIECQYIPQENHSRRFYRINAERTLREIENFEDFKKKWLILRLSTLLLEQISLEKKLKHLSSTKIKDVSFLFIYPPAPFPKTVAHFINKLGFKSIGIYPALIGDRPDAYDFPTDFHLVYGNQLRNLMISFGINPETIVPVGSVNFDRFLKFRNIADEASDTKKVMVLTENFPKSEIELIPIFKTLAQLDKTKTIVKLHPSETVESFYKVFSQYLPNNVEIKDDSLETIIKEADLLIGVNSNVFVQASISGLLCLSVDFSKKSQVLNFSEFGLCYQCTDKKNLLKTINLHLFDNHFIQNAKVKMNHAIKEFNFYNDGKTSERIINFTTKN